MNTKHLSPKSCARGYVQLLLAADAADGVGVLFLEVLLGSLLPLVRQRVRNTGACIIRPMH